MWQFIYAIILSYFKASVAQHRHRISNPYSGIVARISHLLLPLHTNLGYNVAFRRYALVNLSGPTSRGFITSWICRHSSDMRSKTKVFICMLQRCLSKLTTTWLAGLKDLFRQVYTCLCLLLRVLVSIKMPWFWCLLWDYSYDRIQRLPDPSLRCRWSCRKSPTDASKFGRWNSKGATERRSKTTRARHTQETNLCSRKFQTHHCLRCLFGFSSSDWGVHAYRCGAWYPQASPWPSHTFTGRFKKTPQTYCGIVCRSDSHLALSPHRKWRHIPLPALAQTTHILDVFISCPVIPLIRSDTSIFKRQFEVDRTHPLFGHFFSARTRSSCKQLP